MSMSMRVRGIRPGDEKWQKMKGIYDACESMDIDIPEEVLDFFDGEEPCPDGVEINLTDGRHAVAREYKDAKMNAEGYDIDVADIPKDVKTIRFYCSW